MSCRLGGGTKRKCATPSNATADTFAARSRGALTSNLHLRSDFESTSDSTKRNGSRSFCERLRSNAISGTATRNNGQYQHYSEPVARAKQRSLGTSANYGFQSMNASTGSLANPDGEDAPAARVKRQKRDIHGWLVLDKPVGMTSTHAVSVIKHLFAARRAGHAGTLDPLASGCLPIALGEATKTVPFVFDGRKTYRFTIRWGEERDTDDAEGRVVATSDKRPDRNAIERLRPRFTGTIEQGPPRSSAVKLAGERAYDLARDGEAVEIAPRAITVHQLELIEIPDAD